MRSGAAGVVGSRRPREETVRASAPAISRRLPEVDGLRGLAAATVVLHHSLTVLPAIHDDTRAQGLTALNVLKYSPLDVFVLGNQLPLVFFLISGFVLALPFVNGRAPGSFRFLVKRVTRIWPAYAAACLLAFVAATVIGGKTIPSLSRWPAEAWQSPVTGRTVAQHLTLVTDFPTRGFDPVLWSLIHEMRVSLVFPLLAALVLWQRRWWLTVAASIAVAYAAIRLMPSGSGPTSYWRTAVYLQFFVSGIVLARHRTAVIDRVRSATPASRVALAAGSLVLYTSPWWLPDVGSRGPFVDVEIVLPGAVGFLVLAIGAPRAGAVLRTRPVQYLGRVSYSLYLVHAIVLLALLHLFYGRAPLPVLLVSLWPLALGLATLGERYIERPSVALGRRLTQRTAKPSRARDAVATGLPRAIGESL
jgi:peptidoglycan/LPS O-acetylase OafA/YrhL